MTRNIIAILRGVRPDEVLAIGHALVDAGITRIEVPLNSPDPFASIERLAGTFGTDVLIGAGTVLSVADVARVEDVGGRLIVSPNFDVDVADATTARALSYFPGVFTASECFQALGSGADGLKIFPAFQMGTKGLKALRDVLPGSAQVYAVGGVGPADFSDWFSAGANGFGIGGALYKPGDDPATVGSKASDLVSAWDSAVG